MLKSRIFGLVAFGALCVGITSVAVGNVYRAKISRMETLYASEMADRANAALEQMDARITELKGYQDEAIKYMQAAQSARDDTKTIMREFNSSMRGVRSELEKVPALAAKASSSALTEYAVTCSAVFEDVVSASQKLLEAGADMAEKADGHAADVRRITGK